MTTMLANPTHDVFSPTPRKIDPVSERVPLSQRTTSLDLLPSARTTTLDLKPTAVLVPGIAKEIEVKIASEREEWEEAFELVAGNYRARGYEAASAKRFRFTPYHALSETTTFVAKHQGRVVTTFSLVADNTLLGLPMESIYGPEIQKARQETVLGFPGKGPEFETGRRMAEVTSLADAGLSVREFLQVFTALIRLMKQYHVSRGGNTFVIAVNPRHRSFYCKVLGYQTLGPCKAYAAVSDAPAEAYLLDRVVMQKHAPKMYDDIFGKPLPASALVRRPIPLDVIRQLAGDSTQTDQRKVQDILEYEHHYGSPRRW
jgi:hypothetical protein